MNDTKIRHMIFNLTLNNIEKRIKRSHPKDEWRMYTPYLLKYLDQCEVANIVPKKSCNVVFVEFRELNYYHIKFILLNAYKKLGKNFMYTIVCGNLNYEFMERVNQDIGGFNKILKFDINHCPTQKYNVLFLSPRFWEKLEGEKILIYQDDSIIYNGSLLNNFMDYDYVGSPWPAHWGNNSKNVGNGGLSFRTKETMLKALKQKVIYTFEDIFFSRIIINYDIGIVPEVNIARHFSMAMIYTPKIDMFGGHAWWTSMESKVYKFDYCFSRIFKSALIVYDNNFSKYINLPDILDFFVQQKYIIMLVVDHNTKKTLYNTLDKKYYNHIKYIDTNYLYDIHFTEDLKVDYFITIGMEDDYIRAFGKENICYLIDYNKKINRPSYTLFVLPDTNNETQDDDILNSSNMTLDELLYETAIDTSKTQLIITGKRTYLLDKYINFVENQ